MHSWRPLPRHRAPGRSAASRGQLHASDEGCAWRRQTPVPRNCNRPATAINPPSARAATSSNDSSTPKTFGRARSAHLQNGQPCRTTTNQFATITDFAHTNALAPSPYVARSLALIVPGFSAPTSTARLND